MHLPTVACVAYGGLDRSESESESSSSSSDKDSSSDSAVIATGNFVPNATTLSFLG